MTTDFGEPNRELEEQNRKAQEDARRQIDEDNERRKQAQLDAIERGSSTMPGDFETAAQETEEREQPPNPFNARELEQNAGRGQPPAKNVTKRTLPDELKAENIEANEATVPSPSVRRRETRESPEKK